MATWVADLLRSDRSSYDQMIELNRYLSSCDVDMRQVAAIRKPFMTKTQEHIDTVPYDVLTSALQTVFEHYR